MWLPIARPRLEIHGDGGSRLDCGDAEPTLRQWAEAQSAPVQMAYMDPPFMSGGRYRYAQRVGEAGWRGRRDFIRVEEGFSDRWEGPGEYLAMMERVIAAVRELLRDDGCLFLHVDWRVVADLRQTLDRIFGRDRFVNEIIWSYQSGGRTLTHFARKHDNILLYRKGKSFFFDPRPIGVARGPQRRNHMRQGVDDDGRVYYAIFSGGREYRYYEDEPVYPGDVWTDISHLQQKDPERTGYETQKPEALLRRMLLTTTRPGDCVCDPFSGSGTTAAAALATGRRAWVCDRNPRAFHLTRRRMALTGGGFTADLSGIPPAAEPAGLDADLRIEDGTAWVTLNAFTVPGGLDFRTPSLVPREDTLVDYWSVGRVYVDRYAVHDREMRTADRPALKGQLTAGRGPGRLAVHVVDAMGGEHWFAAEPQPDAGQD